MLCNCDMIQVLVAPAMLVNICKVTLLRKVVIKTRVMLVAMPFCCYTLHTFVTRFAKTRHNDAFMEFQIFASVSFMYLKLCSVAISMLYC